MKVIETILPGVLILEPKVHGDSRGFFQETWRADSYNSIGIPAFVQDNHSRSARGVLRGLHAQRLRPQGKLVRVSHGAVFDVAVDINPASPTFGKHVAVELSDSNHKQFYIPPGYAHGFVVLSETADFLYKCSEYYQPGDEIGVLWNDPALGIEWPIAQPLLSEKDQRLPALQQLAEQLAQQRVDRPVYETRLEDLAEQQRDSL
ncbi:MAG: dTDP-4-dehydrorhamnose 3,5-epimerase [Pseudomonadales bacterium]|nr:dTDP-4-dehydrorhamnose 3,5-epimerase [Pseudomonadales bacterium]